MKPTVLAAALTALLSISAPAVAAAQSFGEQIAVTEVEIPVRVLRDGEPVRGLGPEDFEVLDDGEPREIVEFRVIDLTPRAQEARSPSPSAVPAAERGDSRQGRSILVLFDFVFSRSHHLRRSLVGTRRMIDDQLQPEDRIAVAYLTGTGANLVLGFTENREEIGYALDAVEGLFHRNRQRYSESLHRLKTSQGDDRSRIARLNDRFGATAAVAMLGGADDLPSSLSAAGSGVAFGAGAWGGGTAGGGEFNDPIVDRIGRGGNPFELTRSLALSAQTSTVRTVSRELSRLATLLRDVRGQKEMLYLSEGFSSGLIQDALVLRYLQEMFESLRRSGWTLHAVDVGGIPDPFSESGFSAHALHYMSNETGGIVLENYNLTHQATAELIERTSLTYVLTIRPRELRDDGRYHPIQVRLRDRPRGTRLLHRPGYYAPKPASDRSSLERRLDTAELLLGEREIDELGVRVRAGALPAGDGTATAPAAVPFVIEIPTRQRLDLSGDRPLDFELQAYAVDPHGGVQDLWLRRLQLDPRDDLGSTLARGGFRVLGAVSLPPGEYRLRILVRQTTTDRLSLSTSDVDVASVGETLLPLDPLVVDRSGDWLELGAFQDGSGGSLESVFRPQGRLLVPPVSAVSTRGQRLELVVPVATRGPVELSGRLRALDGPAAEAPIRFDDAPLETADGIAVYSAWIDATLAPGDYELEVTARRPDGDDATTGSRRIARLTVLD